MLSSVSPTSVMTKLPLDSSQHKPRLRHIPESPNGYHEHQQDENSHREQQQQRQQQQQQHRIPDVPNPSSVQVAVRIRPLLPFENGNQSCIEVFPEESQTSILKSMSSESTATTSTAPAWSSNESQFSASDHNSSFHHHSQYEAISPSNSISSYQTLQIASDKGANRTRTYTFDHVFPSSTLQIDLYEKCVTPLVQSCIEGYNATVLAYGQTGSGKTHTILGDSSGEIDDVEGTRSNEGVIPRALKQIFNGLENLQFDIVRNESIRQEDLTFGDEANIRSSLRNGKTSNTAPFEYSVKIQFLEVYGEDIRDLLLDIPDSNDTNENHRNHKQLNRQSSVSSMKTQSSLKSKRRSTISIRDGKAGEDAEVLGARKLKVSNADDALQYLHSGLSKRIVGKTAMNANSSRSHAIFTVTIQQTRRKKSSTSDKLDVEMKTSKIHIVDLSGSERVKRSMTIGKSLKEGIDINKGLLVLGNVISALSTSKHGTKTHIPYRDSKLTRLLKGSLGGNHKTLMIACISPSSSNKIESNNTLRYANRAKNIKNKAKINVDPSSRVVNELKEQVVALAASLLKERRMRESNQEYDEEADDCPFSIDFLDELVHGVGSTTLWMKKLPQTSLPTERPQTEPPMRPSLDDSLVTDSWEVSESGINTLPLSRGTTGSENGTIIEDPNVDKNIVSYDFALRKLKESFEEKSDPNLADENNARAFTPSLGKVRTIDELYDYINKPSASDESNSTTSDAHDTVSDIGNDDEPDEVNNVVNGHISKLDETLAHNESLLQEMTKCHKRYETLMAEYMSELQKIQTQVQSYDKDRKKYENVLDLIEEGSQYSDSMIECLKEYETKLEQLEKKRNELKVLTQVADQNDEEIQNLRKSIEVIREQRERMKNIINNEVFPHEGNEVPTQDLRMREERPRYTKSDDSKERNLPSKDSFRYLKEDVRAENSQILEMRREIEFLKQRLYEKEVEHGYQTTAYNSSLHFEKPKYEEPANPYVQSMKGVPTTLNLNSLSADFSALGSSGHRIRRVSGSNGKTYIENNPALVSNPRIASSRRSPSVFEQQGLGKFESLDQTNIKSNQAIQYDERLPTKHNQDNAFYEQRYVYDLDGDVNGSLPKISTRRRIKRKFRGTSKSTTEQEDNCEDICAGVTVIVQFVRKLFGRKKDPVVRQW